jgi:hypothetical protein
MNIERKTRLMAVPLLALLLIGAACKSSVKGTNLDEKPSGTLNAGNANINMNCLGDRLENPPGVFHYSYKWQSGTDSVDKEADITPQSMEITINDKIGAHSFHGIRSDSTSWNRAILDLSGSGMTAMIARVAFSKDSSAITRGYTEKINGYDTTKYSIDTTAANTLDKQTYAAMFGSSSYEKGTIRATDEGCPVQLVLDEASQRSNSVDTAHFEIAMVRK